MTDTASVAAMQPSSPTRRASPSGIENPNPIASTSAHTLDTIPAQAVSTSLSPSQGDDSSATAGAATTAPGLPSSIADQPASVPKQTSDLNDSSDAAQSLDPNAEATISSSMPASLQAAAAGLNEEDAKLLASLAEGNGLLSHLSNLAAQNASSDQLISAYGDLMLDPSNSTLPSADPAFDAAQQAFQGAVDLNEALTRQDMDWDDEAFDDLEPVDEDDQDQGPIQAYAKLEFPGFSYYIQTLDVTIGRRPGQLQPNQRPGAQPPQLPNAASGLSQAHITSESKTEGDVDVDLGPLKSISRLHARVFYYTGPIHPPNSTFLNGTPAHSRASSGNGAAPYRITSPSALSRVNGSHLSGTDGAAAQDPYSMASYMGAGAGTNPEQGEGQFVLMVVGRNGAFVDDVWVEKGGIVVLGKRTKIQIAERVFYFVLPPPPGAAAYSIDGDSQRAHDSESDSLSDLSSEEQDDDEEDEDNDEEEEEDEDGEQASSSSSVSSAASGEEDEDDQEYEGQREHGQGAAQPATAKAEGRRRSSAAASKAELDAANRDDKPKRRLVLKPKSKMGKASTTTAAAAADDFVADEFMEDHQDHLPSERAKAQSKTQAKGKAASKTTAAALANRAAGKGKGKGKGKGAGRGKMPTKGPLPQTRPGADDSDSLGTPSAGEQSSSEGEQDDGINTPPPPSSSRAGASGKRPAKATKGQKSTKKTKAAKATVSEDMVAGTASEGAAGSPVKKESPAPSWAMGAGVAGRKRKRGEPATDEEPALKVGTPIGIEALDAAKRAKAAKVRADASSRAASTSPKKAKTGASASTIPAASTATTTTAAAVPADATTAAEAADDDDVVMLDVKPAPNKPAPSTAKASSKTTASAASSKAAAAATAGVSKPATAPTAASSLPAIAPATAAVPVPAGTTASDITASKAGQKGPEKPAPASSTPAKAKPAKPKTAKPKKKKGAAAEETPQTPSGLPVASGPMAPGSIAGNAPMPAGALPGPYGAPMPYDPNSASAASSIIAAANAVSGSMPGYGPPSAQALPHAVGQMASPLPMIPSAASGRGGPGPSAQMAAYPNMSMPPAVTSLPAPTSTPAPASSAAASGSDPSSWPTTASIIASAASLANAQAKQNQKAASSTPVGSTTPAAPTKNATPAPAAAKPPPGPEDKPDLSNIELISQALRSDHCAKKGGKLTLQEVYEWIANRWVWFKRNGRHTGRDWQSSIRHAIGSSRDFTRIPRRSDEPGKGIFYTMSDSKLAEQHRANLAKQKEEAAKAAAAGTSATVGTGGAAGVPVPGGAAASAASLPPGTGAGPTAANPASAAAAAGAAAAAAGTPGSLPAIRIPLIIGTPPSSAVPAASDKPKAAPGTIESLLETPPIVHHDGKLYLSPQVFGHLNAGQLAQIEGLGAQQALQVLQAYLVTHLKERMRQQQAAAQKKDASPALGKAATTTAATAKAAAATPSTPASVAAKSTPAAPAAASSSSSSSDARAGVAGANGSGSGSASPLKLAAASTASASTSNKSVPATTSLPKPPGSATSLHPMTTLPKPVLLAPIKPSIPSSAQNVAASGGKVNATSLAPASSTGPPNATPSSKGATAAGTAAKAPILPSTPLRTSVPSGPAAAASKPSSPAPTTVASAASPTKPSGAEPVATATTTTQTPKAASPVKPTAPAAAAATASATGNGASKLASSEAAGPSTISSSTAATSSTANPAAPATDSEDPLSALSALAAHPEAAALIALLRKQQQESGSGGGKQLAKLTPGQLQLLQMANKLAAQQGKKGGSGKKKKKAATSSGTGTREGTATPGPSGREASVTEAGASASPGPKAG